MLYIFLYTGKEISRTNAAEKVWQFIGRETGCVMKTCLNYNFCSSIWLN